MNLESMWTLACLCLSSLLFYTGVDGTDISADTNQAVCTILGRAYTHRQWHGFLVQKVFHQGYAKIQYRIQYPVKECCASLLIYYDDQVKKLRAPMTCEERQEVLPNDNNQVIPLKDGSDSNGCTLWNKTGEAFYDCNGERVFRSSVARTWFFAISRCGKSGLLNLNYVFNITGYYGECEEDPLAPSSGWNSYVGFLDNDPESSPSEDVYLYLSISLGIVAGLALIAAAVFFGLWFMAQRNATKSKGSSVTSSQATMTQDDIFYVNPSLSDQGTGQEYSQSGSENYYEVIPERRSYESINTGLANGTLHLRHVRGGHPSAIGHYPHHAHHPHHGHVGQPKDVPVGALRNVHHQIFDNDYPPPPYQPPKLMGVGKHLAPGHAHTLSLPSASQRGQRPPLVHHAYHSSLVPTSAALGHHPGGISNSTSGGNLMGASSSGAGLGPSHMNLLNSGTGFSGNSSMMNNPSSLQSYINPASGVDNMVITSGGMGPTNSSPNTLASFVSGNGAVSNSPNISGINLTPMANHQRMGSGNPHLMTSPHSLANMQPASSAAMASMSPAMSSASHAMATTSGQSETAA